MRKAALPALAVAAGISLAACGSKSGSPSSIASGHPSMNAAVASAAARIKSDPAYNRDLGMAVGDLTACARTAQFKGKPLGLTVVIPMPGSTEQPSVSGLKFREARHPVQVTETILRCTPMGKQGGKHALHVTEGIVLANGIGHGKLATDLQQVAVTLVRPAK